MAVKRQKTRDQRHHRELQSRLNNKPLGVILPASRLATVMASPRNKMPPKKSAAS
jgi:hypothetical protein